MILDRIKSLWKGGTAIVPAKADTPMASTYGVSSTGASFQQSIVNSGPSPLWVNYQPVYSGYGFNPHSADRDRHTAAAVTSDMAERVPTLATIIDSAINSMIGCGLTLSSKPDAARLRITDDEARKLARDIERAWVQWCNDPIECDYVGRHDLHTLITAMAYSYLRQGEAVALIEWAKIPGARTRTKLRVLDASQIDSTKSTTEAHSRTYAGITYDLRGRWAGCWIRPHNLGDTNQAYTSTYVAARTPWGRSIVIHSGELREPNGTRYRTPLMAALTPIKGRETAAEFVLTGFNLQNQYAVTITSNTPANVALGKLEGPDMLVPRTPGAPGPSVSTGYDAATLAMRSAFYKDVRVGIGNSPGTITPLLPGDKLEMNRAETPHENYDALDKSLVRQAARAAGESAEVVSGDFSDTSYSASKLAIIPAHRTAMRRRRIIARIYHMTFDAWLEEAIETGAIKNPSTIPYWRDRTAFNQSKWRGDGAIVADRVKEVQADLLEIQNGLASHESALAARGFDLEDVLEQRAYEKGLFEKYGLPWPGSGAVTTQIRITDDAEDEPAPSKRAKR